MATTFAAIRDVFAGTTTTRGLIEALTPSMRSDDKFKRIRRREGLRAWATGKSTCLRHFEFVRDGEEQELSEAYGQDALVVRQQALVTIAYPSMPALFGTEELDDLEDAIAADAAQVRDCLFSPGNLFSGLYAVLPTINAVERSGDVWFQTISVELQFLKSQTLT